MATEENGGGLVGSQLPSSSSSQRQRFYVELIPGETTIVSWKKLLREAKQKDQCPPKTNTFVGSSLSGAHSSSSAHETPKRAMDDNSGVGQSCDSFVTSERPEHKSRAVSSGCQQQRKRRIEMTKIEGEKNDDPSSAKHVRLENMSMKATARSLPLLDRPFSPSSTSVIAKDNQLDGPQAFVASAPVLMYTKKSSGGLSSKYGCPSPPNAVMDDSVFPLKTKLNLPRKTERTEVCISGDSSDALHQRSVLKYLPLHKSAADPGNQKKIVVYSRSQYNDKSGGRKELRDVVSPGYKSSWQHPKGASSAVNDGTPISKFSTSLGRAIKELEETVAESKSIKVEASDANASWLTIERELPLEVKLKLGKVAKIVQSSQEIISEDLVTCLVSIIGKLVRGRTLKRILRKVVMHNLSARMEKTEKFKEIKNEILTMVANRPPNQPAGAADNPESKEEVILAPNYKLGSAIEDKLCDLYDLCVQGLDGHKGIEVQKLFVELAGLWPKGVMDHHKLRDAISRAKSRRVLADRTQGQRVTKSGSRAEDCFNETVNLAPGLKRKVSRSSSASHKLISAPPGKVDTVIQSLSNERNLMTAAAIPSVTEQKKQVQEKKNVKVRFSLKPEHGTHKPEEQAYDNKFIRPTAAAPLT